LYAEGMEREASTAGSGQEAGNRICDYAIAAKWLNTTFLHVVRQSTAPMAERQLRKRIHSVYYYPAELSELDDHLLLENPVSQKPTKSQPLAKNSDTRNITRSCQEKTFHVAVTSS
jgi:hypothetical protein